MSEQIKELALKMAKLQSFSYSSFSEAKKTVKLDRIEHCFDALSLCEYSTTLNNQQKSELSHYLRDYFYANTNNDYRKCMSEYGVLFSFLQTSPYQHKIFAVSKETKPDFILDGDIRVGIEVVEFITEQNGIMRKIANENFGRGKTAAEIYEAARYKHGSKADQFRYSDFCGSVAISPKKLADTTQHLVKFSSEVLKKWQKYKALVTDFDKFIILCDARLTIAVTDRSDCDELMSHLESLDPSISGISICFLYTGDNGYTAAEYAL